VLRQETAGAGFDVSVLGLGAMGTIIARAFSERGKRVAAWNRTSGKGEALRATGVHICDTPEAALRASPVSILVLLDNPAVREMVGVLRASGALAGRTIVNYSSSNSEESRELHGSVARSGGHYIKGTIVAYPRNIGHPESYCIHTGDEVAFAQHRQLLELLAGHAIFLPWDEAYAFSAALIAQTFSAITAFYETVGAAHHLGLPIAPMARRIAEASRFFVADAVDDAVHRFERGGFSSDQATIDVHAAGFAHIQDYMHSHGASTPIFDAMCGVIRTAQEQGCGQEDIAATLKIYAPVP
jgi:3-hydroxyisobutyrate dehydrogenase-like beta-hydroxyacid dehydrogenase